jgi:Rap1a immunity proteins
MIHFALYLALGLQSSVDPVESGSRMYHNCQANIRVMDGEHVTDSEIDNALICSSYIRGFIDGFGSASSALCLVGATSGTMSRVYVSYMQKNPKLMDSQARIGVLAALKDAYNCIDSSK